MAKSTKGGVMAWPRTAEGPELWVRVGELQDFFNKGHQAIDGPTLYTAQEIASMHRALQQQNAYSQE